VTSRIAIIIVSALLAPGALTAIGCSTQKSVAIINPTDQPLFVQVNQRAPVEVAAGATWKTTLPALDRLTPVTINARNGAGHTVVFLSTSLPRLEANGYRIELKLTGETYDPLASPAFALPPQAQPFTPVSP
jgi:hypothetical protein